MNIKVSILFIYSTLKTFVKEWFFNFTWEFSLGYEWSVASFYVHYTMVIKNPHTWLKSFKSLQNTNWLLELNLLE